MNLADEPTRQRQALVLGLTAGGVTSLVAIVVYFVVPLTAKEYGYGADGMEATFAVLEHFLGLAPLYHVAVLLGTSFVTTTGALLLARRRKLADPETDLTIVGGSIGVPVVTIWCAMFVAVLSIGITDSPGSVPFALLFGIPITILLTGFVIVVGIVGTVSGYALVRGLRRVLDE